MNAKNLLLILFVSLISAVGAVGLYKLIGNEKEIVTVPERQAIQYVNLPTATPVSATAPLFDFTHPAAKTTPAVVHVKTTFTNESSNRNGQDQFLEDDLFRWFYGNRSPRQQQRFSMASGSGVIISSDGYIVTNNHVIENGNEIEVILNNKKSYKAALIGSDKDTDLALLKIEEDRLPMINFANSDSVKVGQWSLAVGNPFNLASTVTAGIVSAKGRNINILQNNNGGGGNTAIESFIQTDAAVNPGNSGGALVDINGELIGVNTAIATPTGTFAGYSFAVPSNLVQKVVEDIKDYGMVQRGFLGVNIRSVDNQLAEELDLKSVEGVYLENVLDGSAAGEAGLKAQDVIIQINGNKVKSAPELQEQVANHRPGDQLSVQFIRNGRLQNASVVLKNKYNSTSLLEENKFILEDLGVELQELTASQSSGLGIEGGLKIKNLNDGKLSRMTDIREGFIITSINEKPVKSIEDLATVMEYTRGTVMIEGIYPQKSNSTYLYAFKN